MTSTAERVQKYVQSRPYLAESLRRGVINYAAMAEQIYEEFTERGVACKVGSIIMALRRHRENIIERDVKLDHYDANEPLLLTTNLCMVTMRRTDSMMKLLQEFFSKLNSSEQSKVNVVQGNSSYSVIIPKTQLELVQNVFPKSIILRVVEGLVEISLKFKEDMTDAYGSTFVLSRKLAWEGITIMNYGETFTETTLLFYEKDSARAFECLNGLLMQSRS